MPAKTTNNLNKTLTTSSEEIANYHDMGAGEISPLSALSPGLVYETTTEDYLYFLCYYGYKNEVISSLVGNKKFKCPADPSTELISELNYPSISVGTLNRGYGGIRTVQRSVMSVGPVNCTYVVQIHAPSGLGVKVWPEKLFFAKRGTKASYQVTFNGKNSEKGYHFGSLSWSDGAHLVRTMFAINVI